MPALSQVKKLTLTAVCTALCVVLPLAFHAIPNGGSLLSPMHLPVLLCGLVCGGPMGLACGLGGPLLSSLVTGMPGAAYLPAMMVELGVYGLTSGLLMNNIRTGRPRLDLYLSLISAMLLGRMAAGLVNSLIFQAGSYSPVLWLSSYFLTAWPGMLLQLLLLPILITALEKAKLIPCRPF